MAGRSGPHNPLVINARPDTSLNVQLHPLVLLTISDYITRHSLRQQNGPIVGAVIGQQDARNFTLENAFECKIADEQADEVTLDGEWFSERLEMYREVHKVPALDLVALFTLGPASGPQPAHLPVLKQACNLTGSDNIMLLLFHPELVDNLQGGKLPISLYESVEEVENDQVHVRFKELAYEVETGDAERIGVDFVAKGGGAATAVSKADPAAGTGGSVSKDSRAKGKGKGKAREEEIETTGTISSVLSPEDDELISSLQAKVNAIKMLNERINLIRTYLTSLSPSYLTDASSSKLAAEDTNFQILRSAQSMLSRLPLLTPPVGEESADVSASSGGLRSGGEMEKQDVHLTSLLASLTRSVAEAQSMGAKFGVLLKEKQSKDRGTLGARGYGGGEGAGTDNGGF
jgi:COP9 signalosome complex subunit 6